jgi:hypothetical protein
MGPVVERLWIDEKHDHAPPPPTPMDEAALNTIGYVLSRYGALTGRDLEVMTHGEPPWQLADVTRRAGGRALIRTEWILDYFRTDGAPDDGVDEAPLDSVAVSAWLRESPVPGDPSGEPGDSLADLHAWAERGAR